MGALIPPGPVVLGSPRGVPPGPARPPVTVLDVEELVDAGADEVEAAAVLKTDFDAGTILVAVVNDTPVARTFAQAREHFDVPQRVFPYPFRRSAVWTPYPNTTTVSAVGLGIPACTSGGSTVTARNAATTSMATRCLRQGFVTAAGAGSVGTMRIPAAFVTCGAGGTPAIGGFGLRAIIVPSDAATVAGSRLWMGVTSFVGAFVNGDPAAVTVGIGFGWGASDSNCRIFYGGSVAQTPIDLGANFPARTLTADVYEFKLFASPAVANSYDYTVTRLNTGDVATGTLTGAATVVPQSTTLLTPFNCYFTNNATALATGLDFSEVLWETNL